MCLIVRYYLCALLAAWFAFHASAQTVVNHIGSGHDWNVLWHPVTALNDGVDGVGEQYDFVGDNTDPGVYVANTAGYFYIRMRLDTPAATAATFRGSHLVMIDVVGGPVPSSGSYTFPNTSPVDNGFAWDSKSNDPIAHGLEMQVLSTKNLVWDDISMDDIDGSNGQKIVNDINGNGRTGDGYVRSIDGQATTNFNNTTYLDFSVSWNYLETYTGLRRDQTWNIALGSIAGATDHNLINADVAGGATITSATTIGFAAITPSGLATIPEVSSSSLCALAGFLALFSRRRQS